MIPPFFNAALETAPPETIAAHQLQRVRQLLAVAMDGSPSYGERLLHAGLPSVADIRTLDDLGRLPVVSRAELVGDQRAHPPFGTRLTLPIVSYGRLQQTSGTSGSPLRMLATAAGWERWKRCWGNVNRVAGVRQDDRVYAAFSFGPSNRAHGSKGFAPRPPPRSSHRRSSAP